MSVRTATCMCGQLTATCDGEPFRISVCHCLDCQKRSGSSFAAQARFPADRVTTSGDALVYVRTADSGETALNVVARQRPSLIVLDAGLRTEDGAEVLEVLQKFLEAAWASVFFRVFLLEFF